MPRLIHAYRPQRTSPEFLEAIFVAREALLQEILDQVGKWKPGASRQHYLLIGPRGIGKTYLLQLIQCRIENDPKLNKKWITLSLSEENYSITRVSDLLIEAVRILSKKTKDHHISAVYEQIRYDNDDKRVVDLSLDALRNYHKQTKTGILLMIENLNRILGRQLRQKSEIHLLRKILIEEDWLVTICTSPTFLDEVTQPEEPFFEFFLVKFLHELTPDEQQEMLYKLADLENNTDFKQYLDDFRPRLRALYHFTGGNPRLTVMLYDLVINKNIREVKSELDLLLDELTPFYQDRMKELSEQEGKLLETMSLLPEGCTPTELAKEARMDAKLVRGHLTRLEKSGYVKREARRKKRTPYIIPERFFRIWHQMNNSRAVRGHIQYLLEFFSNWYATQDERNKIWNELTARFENNYVEGDHERIEPVTEFMEYVIEVSKGTEKYSREFDLLLRTKGSSERDAFFRGLERLDKKYHTDGDYFLHKGYFLANDLGYEEESLAAFEKAVEFKKDDIQAQFNQAVALERSKRWHDAQDAFDKTISLLSRGKAQKSHTEATDLLLQILKRNEDSSTVKVASYLLARTAKKEIATRIIDIVLETSDFSWRLGHCCTALGLLRSLEAIPTLMNSLKNQDHIVRGSAATALGRIGAEQAVPVLIECLSDQANNVRGSAATALGRIAIEKPVPDFDRIVTILVENLMQNTSKQIEPILSILLQAAFRSANLTTLYETFNAVKLYDKVDQFCEPYLTAYEYLKSDKDPAILERQQPEMREAIQLLVNVFEEGQQQMLQRA